jgi:hypothetical protein
MTEKNVKVEEAEASSLAITQLKTQLDAIAKEETVLKSNRIEVRDSSRFSIFIKECVTRMF